MKTIIAGSRSILDYDLVKRVINGSIGPRITEVVCGGARGVDVLGAKWATENNIPIKYFYADWDAFGRSAGYIRNKAMGEYANALIAIWDGESRGTLHMINIARQLGLVVKIATLNK